MYSLIKQKNIKQVKQLRNISAEYNMEYTEQRKQRNEYNRRVTAFRKVTYILLLLLITTITTTNTYC
jgi:hypothetical protein